MWDDIWFDQVISIPNPHPSQKLGRDNFVGQKSNTVTTTNQERFYNNNKKNEICILYWELDKHSLLDEGYIYLSTSQNRRTYMYYAVHDKVLSRNECYIICKIQVQSTYICRNFVWLTESRFKTFISKSFHWVLLKPYRINITLVFGHPPPPDIKSRNWAVLSRLCCNKSIQRWKSGYCIMTTQKTTLIAFLESLYSLVCEPWTCLDLPGISESSPAAITVS